MRVFAWALDSWKTPLGKVISVILSIALIFSCSNAFLASSRAYAAGATEGTEEVDGDNSSDPENSGEPENGNGTTFADDVDDADDLTEDEELVIEDEEVVEDETTVSNDGINKLALGDEPVEYALTDTTISVGDTKTVTGSSAYDHRWTSDNTSVATVSGNWWSRNATVTGIKSGTATITHSFRNGWSWQTETFQVKVEDANETTRVYVYVKVEGDTTGWTFNDNKDGVWCTLGYMDVPTAKLAQPATGLTADESVVIPYLGSIVRHDSNKDKNIDLNAITWSKTTGNAGLHVVSNGADGYVDGLTWHLDGYLYVNEFYTVNYVVEGLENVAANPTVNADIINNDADKNGVTGSTAPAAPTNYTFLGWYKGDELIAKDLVLSESDAKENINEGNVNNIKRYLNTTYTAKYAQTVTVSYDWGKAPAEVANLYTLPQGETIIRGETYSVDATEYAAVPTYDKYGNKNGEYGFSGWTPTGDITVNENIVIKGSWTHHDENVATHNVSYKWNLPTDLKFFDADGNVVTAPSVPVDPNLYVYNQPYTVASTSYADLYTQDNFGNKTAKYAFVAWDKAGEQKMGNSDVTINGTWKMTTIPVNTWTITYKWYNDIYPESAKLPSEITGYVNNRPYTVNDDLKPGNTVNTFDKYSNVNGVYTFKGWDKTGTFNVTGNVVIDGTWEFTPVEVAKHNVTYAWTGLPANTTLYDADGNEVIPELPSSITGLVKGQEYTVDTTKPGTTVYAHDAYGNKTAAYTLGAWDKSGEQKMGDSDVTINAAWTPTSITAPSYIVSYIYDGNIPAGVTQLPENASYVANQPVTIAAKPALAGWEFEGWTLPNGIDSTDNSFTLAESQIPENKVVTLVGTWKAANVDFKVDSVDVVYDGDQHPLTVSGSLLENDEVYYTINGGRFDNTQTNVTKGYINVTASVVRDGLTIWSQATTVRITPAPLNIQIAGNTDTVYYNGENQSVMDYTTVITNGDGEEVALPEGLEIETTKDAVATGINAGTYKMGLNGTSFWTTGENRANYDIKTTVVDGSLTIEPTPVMVVVANATKVAGAADPTFESRSITGFIYNNEIVFNYYRPNVGIDEAIGTYEGALTADYVENPNYAVTVFPGDFTITAAPVPPTPVTPVTPPTPAPTPVTPVTPAPAPATPATPATVATIDDNPTPMAENAQDVIEDDAVPMGAFDEPECWVHILMIIGIILTMIYGVAVVARRLGYKREIDKMDKDLTTSERRESSASHSRGQVQGA